MPMAMRVRAWCVGGSWGVVGYVRVWVGGCGWVWWVSMSQSWYSLPPLGSLSMSRC